MLSPNERKILNLENAGGVYSDVMSLIDRGVELEKLKLFWKEGVDSSFVEAFSAYFNAAKVFHAELQKLKDRNAE